jgi:hypothetical protein
VAVRRRPRGDGGIDALADPGRLDEIAGFHSAALGGDEVDAEVLMAERRAQRAGNVEVAPAGVRIDVGRAAAAVAAVDPEGCAADAAGCRRSIRTPPRAGRRRCRCSRGTSAD